MPKTELIIFDFDGVLVDSEHLSSAIHAETLQLVGVPLSHADIDKQYTGLDFNSILSQISDEFGADKTEKFAQTIEANYKQKMQAELQLMPHMLDFLNATDLAICIASNSKMSRLINNQQVTKIEHIFDGKTYSADMVERPKPAPDLFLFAAQRMGFAPQNCLVIEDGAHGIRAAREAGIKSVGFYGGSHCKTGHGDRLKNAGALYIFNDMSQLAGIIESINNG